MRLARRLFGHLPPAQRALGWTLFLGLLTALVIIGQAWVLSWIIDGAFLRGEGVGDLSGAFLLLMLLAGGRFGLAWAQQISAQRLASLVKDDLRQRLARHLLALGPGFTRQERSGELSNSITAGVEKLDAYLTQYLPQVYLSVLVPLAFLVLILPLDWLSGLILLFTAPLIPLFMFLVGTMADDLVERQWRQLSLMSAHFLDVLQGLTTLKIFNRSRAQIEVVRRISDELGNTTLKVLRVAFLSTLVMELASTLSIALIAGEIGLRVLFGGLSYQIALFILILAPEFYQPLRLLGTRYHLGKEGAEAAQRLLEIGDRGLGTGDRGSGIGDRGLGTGDRGLGTGDWGLGHAHAPRTTHHGGLDTPGKLPPGYSTDDNAPRTTHHEIPNTPISNIQYPLPPIRFEVVSLRYPGERGAALDGVSFELAAGGVTGVIGPSGAGKSSLIQLLLGFAMPSEGRIWLGDQPLGDVDLAWWRAQIAWVSQTPHLFHGTVAENLRLARPEATDGDLVAAAQQAAAHDFITSLPQGYETHLGDLGQRLSGGQRQRIALARAFLKDAPILILDEATANLDRTTEAQVMDRLLAQRGARTVLLVAHRLNTVQAADRILLLQGGRLMAQGGDQALRRDPQAQGYRDLLAAFHGEGGG
jgi:ATP-binding cassette subfamily C protein CydD